MGSIDIIKALSTVLSNMKKKILGNSENLTRGYWVRSHFFMQPPCYADHSLEQKAFYSLVPYCRDYYNLRNSVKLLVRKKTDFSSSYGSFLPVCKGSLLLRAWLPRAPPCIQCPPLDTTRRAKTVVWHHREYIFFLRVISKIRFFTVP